MLLNMWLVELRKEKVLKGIIKSLIWIYVLSKILSDFQPPVSTELLYIPHH